MNTYIVTPHGENAEPYEIEADAIIVDEGNTNRVTFVNENGATVGQENSALSVRPK